MENNSPPTMPRGTLLNSIKSGEFELDKVYTMCLPNRNIYFSFIDALFTEDMRAVFDLLNLKLKP